MSASRGDLVAALECAARADDAALFDAALDRVLESARDEADPEIHLQELVAERLHGTLSGVFSGESGAATLSRAGQIVPVAATATRSTRFVRGISLLAAGVAIGFIWGRSPLWSSSDRAAAPDVARSSAPAPSAPALTDSSRHEAPPSAIAISSPVPSPSTRRSDADSSPSKPNSRHAKRNSRHAKAEAVLAPDSLRFALEQLRKAQLLLRSSKPQRALAELDLLDARVARSVLEEEREVTRTLALCDAGDVAAASALAQRLLERAPGSAYAVSLRESCAGKAALLDQMRERTSNSPR